MSFSFKAEPYILYDLKGGKAGTRWELQNREGTKLCRSGIYVAVTGQGRSLTVRKLAVLK
jgi:hypothetical protein